MLFCIMITVFEAKKCAIYINRHELKAKDVLKIKFKYNFSIHLHLAFLCNTPIH